MTQSLPSLADDQMMDEESTDDLAADGRRHSAPTTNYLSEGERRSPSVASCLTNASTEDSMQREEEESPLSILVSQSDPDDPFQMSAREFAILRPYAWRFSAKTRRMEKEPPGLRKPVGLERQLQKIATG